MTAASARIALLALSPALQAWPASPRSFASLNEVPVWTVATVEEVIQRREVPAGERRFTWENRRFEARLLIRRVFAGSTARSIGAGGRIVRYATFVSFKYGAKA